MYRMYVSGECGLGYSRIATTTGPSGPLPGEFKSRALPTLLMMHDGTIKLSSYITTRGERACLVSRLKGV